MPKNQCKTKYPLYLPKIGQHSAGHLSAFIASFSLSFLSLSFRVYRCASAACFLFSPFFLFLSGFIGVHQRLTFFSLFFLSLSFRVYPCASAACFLFSLTFRVYPCVSVACFIFSLLFRVYPCVSVACFIFSLLFRIYPGSSVAKCISVFIHGCKRKHGAEISTPCRY